MKRRHVLPLMGAAGMATVAGARSAASKLSDPQLKRVAYQSARTGKERDYFVYLPRGHAQKKDWPVMMFLHGDGERGDGKGELDYVLIHGPLFEAWCQKRDLPFIIISPQLPMFGRGEQPYIKDRKPEYIPTRRPEGINPRPDLSSGDVRLPEPMNGKASDDKLPEGPQGLVDGWFEIENELIDMLDRTVASFKGDSRKLYLTGLSYGGFGTWYMAAHHAQKFAAIAPIVGYGHPDHAAPIAAAKLPLWQFAGGRDPVVPLRFFYPLLNRLEALGHPEVRFTVHEDLGHLAWVRVYEGEDLYAWLLRQSR